MGVTIFDLFGEIFSENDMINFLKENGVDPNGLIGGGLAIRCFLLLKAPDQVSIDQSTLIGKSRKTHPEKLPKFLFPGHQPDSFLENSSKQFSKISVFRGMSQIDFGKMYPKKKDLVDLRNFP